MSTKSSRSVEPVVTSIRLPKDDLEWLRGRAASAERTVSAEIRLWITQERARLDALERSAAA